MRYYISVRFEGFMAFSFCANTGAFNTPEGLRELVRDRFYRFVDSSNFRGDKERFKSEIVSRLEYCYDLGYDFTHYVDIRDVGRNIPFDWRLSLRRFELKAFTPEDEGIFINAPRGWHLRDCESGRY